MNRKARSVLVFSVIIGFALVLHAPMASAQQTTTPPTPTMKTMPQAPPSQTPAAKTTESPAKSSVSKSKMPMSPAKTTVKEASPSKKATAQTHKMPAKASMKKGLSGQQIKAVQKALNSHGFKLAVDGIMGPHTRAALRSFQKENHLKVTGKPDKATLAKLNV